MAKIPSGGVQARGLNLGYMQVESVPADGVGAVTARIYYDPAVASPGQPLINGPRGYSLDVTNTTGRICNCQITTPAGQTLLMDIGPGDPVTNRSRTAAQLSSLGYSTREDATGLQVSINE